MPHAVTIRRRRTPLDTVVTVSAGILVATLAGCTPVVTPATTPSGSPTDGVIGSASPSGSASESPAESPAESPSASSSTAPSPAASAPVAPGATPVTAACTDLVSLQTMYDFDPNFGLLNSYTPQAGAPAADAARYSGVACRWVQQSSGQTIDIAAAHPPASALAELEAKAGTLVSSGAYYSRDTEGYGIVQLFNGRNWIVARSEFFLAPADAAPLTDSVTAALR